MLYHKKTDIELFFNKECFYPKFVQVWHVFSVSLTQSFSHRWDIDILAHFLQKIFKIQNVFIWKKTVFFLKCRFRTLKNYFCVILWTFFLFLSVRHYVCIFVIFLSVNNFAPMGNLSCSSKIYVIDFFPSQLSLFLVPPPLKPSMLPKNKVFYNNSGTGK